MGDPENAPAAAALPEMPAAPKPEAPPPHPPRAAVHFGKPRPKPHLRPTHEQVMKRPGEKLHLAKHHMHPHPDQPESDK